jgi:hypothetical protein
MAEINSHLLLATDTVAVWDVLCSGTCKHKSAEECVSTTHLVFPYRGVYVHHTGQVETVVEANQVVFFNEVNPIELAILLKAAMQVYRSESMRRRCWSWRLPTFSIPKIESFSTGLACVSMRARSCSQRLGVIVLPAE